MPLHVVAMQAAPAGVACIATVWSGRSLYWLTQTISYVIVLDWMLVGPWLER